MLPLIKSLDNSKVKNAYKAKSNGGDLFLLEGFHNVEMALENHLVDCLFSLKPYLAENIEQYLVTPEIISKLSFTKTPEGIVALCHKKAPVPVSSDKLLYLERVQDPSNVGALLRSALAFGFADVILSKGCADPYNPKSLLSSQGALYSLNVAISNKEPAEDVSILKDASYLLLGSSLASSKPLEGYVPAKQKLALFLGNEGAGMSQELLSLMDENLRISISGIDSLNVSVAGGILMHDLSYNLEAGKK